MNNNPLEQFITKNHNRAEEYKEIIESMMRDYSSYHYAENTLLSILDFIEKNNLISNAQCRAVNNIKNKPSLHGQRKNTNCHSKITRRRGE